MVSGPDPCGWLHPEASCTFSLELALPNDLTRFARAGCPRPTASHTLSTLVGLCPVVSRVLSSGVGSALRFHAPYPCGFIQSDVSRTLSPWVDPTLRLHVVRLSDSCRSAALRQLPNLHQKSGSVTLTRSERSGQSGSRSESQQPEVRVIHASSGSPHLLPPLPPLLPVPPR